MCFFFFPSHLSSPLHWQCVCVCSLMKHRNNKAFLIELSFRLYQRSLCAVLAVFTCSSAGKNSGGGEIECQRNIMGGNCLLSPPQIVAMSFSFCWASSLSCLHPLSKFLPNLVISLQKLHFSSSPLYGISKTITS